MSQNKTLVRKTSVGTTRIVKPYQRHNHLVLDVETEEPVGMEDDLNVGDWRALLDEANADEIIPDIPVPQGQEEIYLLEDDSWVVMTPLLPVVAEQARMDWLPEVRYTPDTWECLNDLEDQLDACHAHREWSAASDLGEEIAIHMPGGDLLHLAAATGVLHPRYTPIGLLVARDYSVCEGCIDLDPYNCSECHAARSMGLLNLDEVEKARADLYAQQQLAYNALVDVNTLSQHQIAWNIVAAEQAAEFAAEQRDHALLMTLPF